MRKLTMEESRKVDGGFSTRCPICHKKVSVGFFEVLMWGKTAAYRDAQEKASARHWSYSRGYVQNVRHY